MGELRGRSSENEEEIRLLTTVVATARELAFEPPDFLDYIGIEHARSVASKWHNAARLVVAMSARTEVVRPPVTGPLQVVMHDLIGPRKTLTRTVMAVPFALATEPLRVLQGAIASAGNERPTSSDPHAPTHFMIGVHGNNGALVNYRHEASEGKQPAITDTLTWRVQAGSEYYQDFQNERRGVDLSTGVVLPEYGHVSQRLTALEDTAATGDWVTRFARGVVSAAEAA